MTLSPTAKTITLLLVILAFAGVIMSAIAVDRLGDFVLGLGIVGVIVIILASIGVFLFGKWGSVNLDLSKERNRHIEAMFSRGALPNNERYKLLPKPETEYDVPVDTSGETATSIVSYRQEALELVALSTAWHKAEPQSDPTQIVPQRRAKEMHEYFRGGDGFIHWQHGVGYLRIMQLADERRQGNRSLGTFAHSPTEQLYVQMKQRGG